MENFQCMICKHTENVKFVSICYENGHNSVKSDILELCGTSIQDYLQEEDVVCISCMHFLRSCAQMKSKVCELIMNRPFARKNVDVLDTQKSDAEYSDKSRSLSAPSTSIAADYEVSMNTPSPNLLVATSSIPYDERADTPTLDREIQFVNSQHRRRRRGNNWTRRKGSQSRNRSKSASVYRFNSSRTSHRSRGTQSTVSNRKLMLKQAEELQMRRILSDFLYQNDSLSQFTRAYLGSLHISEEELADILTQPIVRTRFARDVREKLLGEYEKLIFECPKTSCSESFYNLEDLTKHMVVKHNQMAWFRCEQCKFSYLTKAHLDKHTDRHYSNFMAYCIYCSEEFKDKRVYEEHLNEHLVHSFPCIYCDRFFLTRQQCDNHIRENHPGKKKKIKRIKPQSILDRIDKNGHRRHKITIPDPYYCKSDYSMKILTQPGPTVNTEPIPTTNAVNDCNYDVPKGEDTVEAEEEKTCDLPEQEPQMDTTSAPLCAPT